MGFRYFLQQSLAVFFLLLFGLASHLLAEAPCHSHPTHPHSRPCPVAQQVLPSPTPTIDIAIGSRSDAANDYGTGLRGAFWRFVNSIKPGDIVALLAIFGSFIALIYYPTRMKRLEMPLKFVEEQLEKLYGPLLASCIAADSMFRRVELALKYSTKATHRHYHLRELRTSHFKEADPDSTASDGNLRLFAHFIDKVYLPLNQERTKLIQHNLHLLGPYPPLSINLFLTHAAQFESLLRVMQETNMTLPHIREMDRYTDPYILMPYPVMLTAEAVAKVALLKALQNEHRYIIGHSKFFPAGDIFYRDQYFLVLNESIRQDLCKATDTRSEGEQMVDGERTPVQRAFYPPSCPLVWGPYTAIELFELRSWLINRYIPMRALDGVLAVEYMFMKAVLEAKIAFSDKSGTQYPLHYRVSQLFDELDKPGSKMNHPWYCYFDWEHLQENPAFADYKLQPLSFLGEHTLADIPPADKFAYREYRYRQMRADVWNPTFWERRLAALAYRWPFERSPIDRHRNYKKDIKQTSPKGPTWNVSTGPSNPTTPSASGSD